MSKQDEALIAKQAREKARGEALTDGFIGEGVVTLGGHEIRPFTFGSLTLCRKLKLSLFTDEGAADDLDEATVMRQLAIFFWFQSQPVKEVVLPAIRLGAEKVEELVDEFEFDIDLHAMPAILRRIKKLSALASEAAVEIEPKKNSKDEDEPPNY